jgi:hypothetical protein
VGTRHRRTKTILPNPKAAAPTSQTAQKKDPPVKHTNYTLPENQAVLQKAVDGWLKEQDSCYDSNGEKMELKVYANTKGIPYDTIKKYVCPDKTKQRKVGNAAGRQALVPAKQQKFLVQTAIRYDRANNGKSNKEMTDMIQKLQPGMTRKQDNQSFQCTIHPKFVATGGIKPKEVKAQATTTKRLAIMVKQQFRWHMVMDVVLNML